MDVKPLKICVIIPTFNNDKTLMEVVEKVAAVIDDVIIVNDGSTDNTSQLLLNVDKIVVTHPVNKGKGAALKSGFKRAEELGYTHAITIDSDGQHKASQIPCFIDAVKENPNSIIIGCRNLLTENMPGKNTFANKFSNFWFYLQTGVKLADTQTGFRAYPLKILKGRSLLTSRYEAELALLVFSAWNGIDIKSIPIDVYYPPVSERVSHFRPFMDFFRISILNTFLCIGAIVYGLPMRLYNFLIKR